MYCTVLYCTVLYCTVLYRWNEFLIGNKNSLAKQLIKRINAIQKLRKYVSFAQVKTITSGIFLSKCHYGMELWAGAPLYLKRKIQTLQLSTARAAIGYRAQFWSINQLLRKMGWLSIDKLLSLTTAKLAHQILNISVPEILALKIKNKMNVDPALTRLSGPNKFGPHPKEFGRTRITKYQFKANLYDHYPKIHEFF